MRRNGKYRCPCGFNCVWSQRAYLHWRFCRTLKRYERDIHTQIERMFQEHL